MAENGVPLGGEVATDAPDQSQDVRAPTHICCVGASAGGLEALEQFFRPLPVKTGVAFVVIQHLSPDFKSLMDELLARQTKIPIHRVTHGMPVERDAIYLIPPGKEMVIRDRRLELTDKDPRAGLSMPIDLFLASLAEGEGRRSIAVILSGSGSDGSRGTVAVHRAGGLVLVQRPDTAKFNSMPQAAIAAGEYERALPPELIANAITSYLRDPGGWAASLDEESPALEGMDAVFKLLRDEHGIDFSQYKPTTASRRIARRVELTQSVDLNTYTNLLADDRRELNNLYHDLLVGVTKFFRDPEAFKSLDQECIPRILESVPRAEPVRVWIAGCATGEEAYSVAMLLHRAMERSERPFNAKIFATDAHRISLDIASAGVYDEEALEQVPQDLLLRYFTMENGAGRVSQELRHAIVFAPHNLLSEAPFTRLELISCRNLLIYLQPAAQQRVLALLHYALKPKGFLLLGPSEGLGALEPEFSQVSKTWRVFRKLRDSRIRPEAASPPLSVRPAHLLQGRADISARADGASDLRLIRAYDRLLDKVVPAGVLVNQRGELLHLFGDANKHLRPGPGRTSMSLVDMTSGDLRLAFAAALQRAKKEAREIRFEGTRSEDGDRINLSVTPLRDGEDEPEYFFVEFIEPDVKAGVQAAAVDDSKAQAARPADEDAAPITAYTTDEASASRIQELEDELRYTKENLQSAIEELETSNEEVHAANEELVASNEELQSTNEELHSVNEELYTVNAEFQKKIHELAEVNADMENLLRSTDLGTIFLDRKMTIRRFTPAVTHTFDLLPQDVGRPLHAFTASIEHPGLLEDVEQVLQNGLHLERTVRGRFGKWYLLRILPYRAESGEIDGVVLTFVDVTEMKQIEQSLGDRSKELSDANLSLRVEIAQRRRVEDELRARTEELESERGSLEASEQRFREIAEVISQIFWITSPDGTEIMYLSPAFERLWGRDPEFLYTNPQAWFEDIVPEDRERVRREFTEGVASGAYSTTFRITRPDGQVRWIAAGGYPVRDEAGQMVRIIGEARDVSDIKSAELNLLSRNADLQRANEALDHFASIVSHDLEEPLRTLQGWCAVLERDHAERFDDEGQDILRRVKAAVSRLDELINSLLRFTRLSNAPVNAEPVDLNAVVREGVEPFTEQIASMRGKLEIGQLPPVLGSQSLLVQVIQNLVSNAVKFRSPDRPPEIVVVGVRQGRFCRLSVRDNGVGVEERQRTRIFQMFRRSGAGDLPGLGIGLAFAKKIVEKHGGAIELDSTPGVGSTFSFTLPAVPGGDPGGVGADRPFLAANTEPKMPRDGVGSEAEPQTPSDGRVASGGPSEAQR